MNKDIDKVRELIEIYNSIVKAHTRYSKMCLHLNDPSVAINIEGAYPTITYWDITHLLEKRNEDFKDARELCNVLGKAARSMFEAIMRCNGSSKWSVNRDDQDLYPLLSINPETNTVEGRYQTQESPAYTLSCCAPEPDQIFG